MSQAPSMPVFPDALLADTMDLSTEEFGAYCLILFVTWRNNAKPLPDDPVRMARVVRVTEARWATRIRPALVRFFDLSEGTWRQLRLEKEWEYVAKFSASQSEKGKASARAKALKNNNTISTGVDERSQPAGNPHTQSHTHTAELNSSAPRADADAVQPGAAPKSDAVLIIRAFDDAIAEVFGEPLRRGWPSATDQVTAQRWIGAGADLALCSAVFQAGCCSRKAKGADPPRSLKYFDGAVADAIAAGKAPMPEGHRHAVTATDRRRGTVITADDEDDAARKRSVLDALDIDLEPV